jgi:pyruvate formate lyase activating enzyme
MCGLREGQVGVCTQVGCHDGALYNLAYGVIAEASVTPVESKPVYHYWPGARTLSLGGLGCNLRCKFCQNWEIAFRDARDAAGLDEPNLTADAAVALALAQRCQGLSWSHNEPSITPTYVLDSARAARAVGLFTILVTNGFLTDAAIETLGPWVDVYRVDVKSRDDSFYRRVANIARAGDTLRIASRAQREFGAHVEVVTNVMPGLNDSDDALARIADGIVMSLGSNTPWNLTTYIPYALMRHVPATPLPTLLRARAIGRRSGLRFIYIDHPEAAGGTDTICPTCGAIAIQRLRGRTRLVGVTGEGHCAACGAGLSLVLPPASPKPVVSASTDTASVPPVR